MCYAVSEDALAEAFQKCTEGQDEMNAEALEFTEVASIVERKIG